MNRIIGKAFPRMEAGYNNYCRQTNYSFLTFADGRSKSEKRTLFINADNLF